MPVFHELLKHQFSNYWNATGPPSYVLFGKSVPPSYILFGRTVPPNSFSQKQKQAQFYFNPIYLYKIMTW